MAGFHPIDLSSVKDVQLRVILESLNKFLSQVNLNSSQTAVVQTVTSAPSSTAPHSGGYAEPPLLGSAAPLLKADAALQFPEAVGVAEDRNHRVELTDSAPYGALLAATPGFLANRIALQPPNSTSPLIVYPANVARDGSDFTAGSPTFGLVLADGASDFWRFRMSADGIPYMTNIGSVVPGT